jgi:glycosyltransferase involved in cell wall biosynthesis
MTPWLSILIPAHNVQDYVIECVESIADQCDHGVEIIVLDDKSTDATYARLIEYSHRTHVALKILQHAENSGVSAARNSLRAAASGEYLWFIDSDDVLLANSINELKAIVQKASPDLVMCDFMYWYSHDRLPLAHIKKDTNRKTFNGKSGQLLTSISDLFFGVFSERQLHLWTKITKRSLWNESHCFPVGKYFEDVVVSPRVLLEVKTYIYINRPWVKYRQREGSILAVPTLNKVNDLADSLIGVLSLWDNKYPNLGGKARMAFYRFAFRAYQFCLKDLTRIAASRQEIGAVKMRALQQLYATVGMSKWSLCATFLKRADVKRALRVMMYG